MRYFMLQYSPNFVTEIRFKDLEFGDEDKSYSYRVEVRRGTKITARELEVPQEDFNKFFEYYKQFISLSKEMWQFKAEPKGPETVSLMLREIDEVKTFGSLIVEEELPDLRVYVAIEKGIKGWYVSSISLHHEVVATIYQQKALKYGMGGFDFNFSENGSYVYYKGFEVEGHDKEDVMGDMEIIFGQVTDSQPDPRYSWLSK